MRLRRAYRLRLALAAQEFSPWRGVYRAFSRWAAAGTFKARHDRLRQQWRDRIGRNPEPTAALIDAQSTRSTAQGGMSGFDAGKKVKGRKRHLVVDTLGLLLAVTVTSAAVQDRDAAALVVAHQAMAKVPGLRKLCTDAAYGGQCAQAIEKAYPALNVEVVRHPATAARAPGKTRSRPCGPRSSPVASSFRPSAGSSSVPTPGTSAHGASSRITIAPSGRRLLGSGWSKRISLRLGWQGNHFGYTL